MSTTTLPVMSSRERLSSLSLGSIFALRMLGLFLILPVFSIFSITQATGKGKAAALSPPANFRDFPRKTAPFPLTKYGGFCYSKKYECRLRQPVSETEKHE